jgi:hypothetical protein
MPIPGYRHEYVGQEQKQDGVKGFHEYGTLREEM